MSQMSISKPVKISYRWDRENFDKAFSNAYTHQYKNSARRYIGWLFVAMAQFGVVAALKGGSIALLMFSTILILYWYVIKKWILKRRALAAFERSPMKDRNITLDITPEEIKQGDRSVPWEALQGVVPVEDDIMLYDQDRAFYIPSNAFASVEDKNRIKSWAKEKGRLFDV